MPSPSSTGTAPFTGLSQAGRNLLNRAKTAEHTFMVVVALVIGVLAGLGAVGFRWLIQEVQTLTWATSDYTLEWVRARPWWWVVLAPALGGALVGPLVHFLAREAKGHGVPEVMDAVASHSGIIRPRLVAVKSLASALSIGTGGSVGREGPIVQIGSALGSSIGQWLRVSGHRLRTLVGCGAAAGIAATFNAPVAGALFAVEVILGDFAVSQFSPIVISSVAATVVSRYFLGDFPAFVVPSYALVSPWELIFYLLLGLVAALVSLSFIRVLYKFEDLFEAIPVAPWLLTPVGGALVGALGLWYPEILGVGYEAMDNALAGDMTWRLLLLLVGVKLLATSLTIGSGGSGGVFAPSLFLGAMTGGALGQAVHGLFPQTTAAPGAYALVGMGAVVAGTTHAPITAILILFELTSDYKLIVPLMAACIISTLVTTRVQRESIYTMKLLRRGVEIFRGRDINVLRSLRVKEVMSSHFLKVAPDEPLGRLLARLTKSPYTYGYIANEKGHLAGVISLAELGGTVFRESESLTGLVVASDLARTDVPMVTPEQDLDTVTRIFSGKNRDELPVVRSVQEPQLLGVVSRRHLMDTYNQELMKRDMASGLGAGLSATSHDEVILDGQYRMRELEAPGDFVNRTLGELNVRSRYGVQVLLVRRARPSGDPPMELVPGPETRLEIGDHLVLMGREADLRKLTTL